MTKKIIIILGVVGCSLSAILVRFSDASSTVLVFYRMLFSVLLLLPMVLSGSVKEYKKIEKKYLLLCILSGLFLGAHFTCYFEGLKHTSIASCVSLVDTEVFFVALGGTVFLHEKLSKKGWLCILITFLGSTVVAAGDMTGGGILGDVLALLGAVCSCVYTLIGRKLRAFMSTTAYTWIVYFFAGIVVFVGTMTSGNCIIPINMRNLLIGLGLAVFCTLLGHSIFSWGLKYEKASFVSTVKLLEPVFAAIIGVFAFHEIPSWSSIVGGCLIIIGIIFLCKQTEEG